MKSWSPQNFYSCYQDLKHQSFCNFMWVLLYNLHERKQNHVRGFLLSDLSRSTKLMFYIGYLPTLKAAPHNFTMLSIIWMFFLLKGKFFYSKAQAVDSSFCANNVISSTQNWFSFLLVFLCIIYNMVHLSLMMNTKCS